MKFLGFDSALCLSPHPDDVELSMSGAIKKFSDTQFRIVCCSIGTQSDNSSGVQRHREINAFWNNMNCTNVDLCFVEDYINLRREDEWVGTIEKEFLADSQAIFTTSAIDSHFEHKIVHSVALALTRHKALALIEYKSFSTVWGWVPNLLVDITEQYELKISSLVLIRSQISKNYFHKTVLDAAHTDMQCAKKQMQWVEQFNILSIYG